MSDIRKYMDLMEAASYRREIPRDLFNEANLLKCYGQIYIQLEHGNYPNVELVHNGGAFAITQDQSDGSLCIANVRLIVQGRAYNPRRPLNSRQSWPLYLWGPDDVEIEVFTDTGVFTEEMMVFLRGAPAPIG
jgi:hypothetical protein